MTCSHKLWTVSHKNMNEDDVENGNQIIVITEMRCAHEMKWMNDLWLSIRIHSFGWYPLFPNSLFLYSLNRLTVLYLINIVLFVYIVLDIVVNFFC